jgi:hypothetical protein
MLLILNSFESVFSACFSEQLPKDVAVKDGIVHLPLYMAPLLVS